MKLTNALNRWTQLTKNLGFSNLKLSWIQTGINLSNKASNALADVYNEVDGDELKLEIHRLRRYVLVSRNNNQGVICGNCTILVLLQWMVKWGFIESLPNLIIAIRIFLILSISVASCERSFSKLKLIMNYLRSTMSQIRLTSIAILSIERDMTDNTNFDYIIIDFAALKARRTIY